MGATSELVKHAIDLKYSDLPEKVINKTKEFILDTLAVAVAGSSAEGCRDVVDQMVYWGGRPESTIWIFGYKAPSFHAAMANGMMSHARDFDDTHEVLYAHCHSSVLPAVLTAAEQKGEVNGEELITAITLGVDILCRLGQSIKLFYGWHDTGVLGAYGSAFAAAKILGLDEEKTRNTIGIVHAQIPGCNRQARQDGTLAKRMQPGFAAMAGVFSANLANRGLTGAKAALEGEHGFFNLYKDHGEDFNPDQSTQRLLEGLGTRYEVLNLSMKPYPSCRSTHSSIDAALEIVRSNQIDPDDVESATVYISDVTMEKVGKPFKIRTNPQVDAQFSIPYTIAVALSREKVVLNDFEPHNVGNQKIIKLAEKITCIAKPELKARVPLKIDLKMKDGQTLSKTVSLIKGHPEKPLTRNERIGKVQDCWNNSDKPLGKEKMDQLISTIDRLEEIKQVKQLVEKLT